MSQAIQSVEGVVKVDVSFADETAVVQAKSPACTARGFDEMNDALGQHGYSATLRSAR